MLRLFRLSSRRGISWIVVVFVLIVVAVASMTVTYVWVMSLETEETEPSLVKQEVRFYGSATGAKNRVEIILGNTGNEDIKIVAVYWSGSSFEKMVELKKGTDYELNPDSGVVGSLSTISIVIVWGAGATDGAWASGTTYYFKVVTEKGSILKFTAEAP